MPLLRKVHVPNCPTCKTQPQWDNLENIYVCNTCTWTIHPQSMYDMERLNFLADSIHESNVAAGWWDDKEFTRLYDTVPHPLKNSTVLRKYAIPTKIVLLHSEASEMVEGFRKDLMDDHLPHRRMDEVEAADIFIRLMDLAGSQGWDIGGAVLEKRLYNSIRPDHKLEARAAEGGKKI